MIILFLQELCRTCCLLKSVSVLTTTKRHSNENIITKTLNSDEPSNELDRRHSSGLFDNTVSRSISLLVEFIRTSFSDVVCHIVSSPSFTSEDALGTVNMWSTQVAHLKCVQIVHTNVCRTNYVVIREYLPNMSLTDQYTGMMDRFGQSKFEHLGLETTFQEIFDFQTQHVIEFHVRFIQYTDTDQTTQECVTCWEKWPKKK